MCLIGEDGLPPSEHLARGWAGEYTVWILITAAVLLIPLYGTWLLDLPGVLMRHWMGLLMKDGQLLEMMVQMMSPCFWTHHLTNWWPWILHTLMDFQLLAIQFYVLRHRCFYRLVRFEEKEMGNITVLKTKIIWFGSLQSLSFYSHSLSLLPFFLPFFWGGGVGGGGGWLGGLLSSSNLWKPWNVTTMASIYCLFLH